jgi:hypothetical protein
MYITLPIKIGTTSNGVVCKVFPILLIVEIFQRVSPEKIAHGTKRRRLLEPIQLNHQTTDINIH